MESLVLMGILTLAVVAIIQKRKEINKGKDELDD